MATNSRTSISYGEFLSKISKCNVSGSPTSAERIVSAPSRAVIFMATFGESTITSSDSAGSMSPVMPKSTSLETVLFVRSYWHVTAKPKSDDVTIVSWCWITTSFMYRPKPFWRTLHSISWNGICNSNSNAFLTSMAHDFGAPFAYTLPSNNFDVRIFANMSPARHSIVTL